MILSIIVPAYNEEHTIKKLLDKVLKQNLKGIKKEVIVINDGSTDSTSEILKEIKGIKILSHEKNRGKGAAIRTGLTKATGEIILIQDGDLELDPKDYPALVEPIIQGKAKVVYGSRILGNNIKPSALYYSGGKVVTFFANILYGINITDEPIGYKVFRSEVLKSLNLKCERFEFCPEVTAKVAKKGINIYEVPVSYNPRSKRDGKKLSVKDGIEAVFTLIRYRFRD